MNRKFWIVLAIILAAIFLLFFNKKETTMVNPQTTQTPTSIPSPTPKSFKFDRTSDLQKELESVNPQVLESDFE